MKRICILFVFIITCFSGCNSRQPEKQEVSVSATSTPLPDTPGLSPYLSITESYYTDTSETGIGSQCIIYDLQTKKFVHKGSVDYTSAYPLAAYSKNFDDIFFSADSGHGDQVYQYSNNQNIQLTDKFYAINYIIPCGNKLFVAAKLLKHYCIEPFIFDPVSKEVDRVFEDKEDDRFTWSAGTMPESNSVLFSYYSDSVQRNCDENDCSTSGIALLNMETGKVKQIYKIHKYIWGVAGNEEKLYICCAKAGVGKRNYNILYEVDMATKKKKKLDVPIVVTEKLELWDNTLYCIGREKNDENRGIYAIDLDSLKAEPVYLQQEDAFINDFSMCY